MATAKSLKDSSKGKADDKQCDIHCLIWLDDSTDTQDTRNAEQKLRSIINYLKRFQDVKPCQKYIEQSTHSDRIILIVSGRLGQEIVPSVHAIRQVVAIYVYCMNKTFHKTWSQRYNKVRAVVDDLDELVDRIAEDHNIQKKVDEPLAFDVFSAGQSTSGVNGQFVFSQVLFDCLLRLKATPADKAELIGNCKTEYAGNRMELEHIQKFETDYAADRSLRWYTKDSFFYKSLNAALRKQNIHMIFLFREFISDIQQQLQKNQSSKVLKVYRGQMMAKEELERLKQSIGKLISINSFFSTSVNYKKIFTFLNFASDLEKVIFEIKADPSTAATKPFADISKHSEYPGEAEVLFMIGSIFRLENIERDDMHIWVVRMTLSSDEEHSLKQVLAYMKGQIGSGETNLRTLGRVLWKMGKFDLAEKYFMRLLSELKADDPLKSALYEDLGELASLRGDFDSSVEYHNKALRLKNGKEANETNALESMATAMTTNQVDTSPQTYGGTDGNATTSTGIDAQQFKQWLEVFLKQNAKTLAQQSSAMKRHPQSVENFCYILENQPSATDDEQQALRGLINLGFTFDDVNSEECIKLVRGIQNERIILILSKTSLTNLAKPIREEPFLSAVYVIDAATDNSFDFPLYRRSVPNITQLCKQLEKDLPLLTYDLTIISSIPADYARMSTLNYVQSLKEILLEADEKRSTKKDMVEFCREKYAGNTVQLKLIDEFANRFQPDQAIQWYSRHEAFVYKMLTRALRNLDLNILYKLRYFIQHLHRQLESSSSTNPLTVYRTFRVRKDHFGKMKSYDGGLLSFNEFLFASKTKPTTEPFPVNITSKLVHFQINLGAGIPRLVVSNKTNEVLLTLGTVFHIDAIEPIDEETFTVKLTADSDVIKAGRTISKDLRDATRGSFPLIRMVKLLKQKDSNDEMEFFASMLMNDPQTAGDETATLALGAALHSLGGSCYERKQYDQGLVHLQNSLKVYLRVLPADDIRLTPTYNNIGSIYHRQELNEKALEYHMKAYDIQRNSANPDMDSVAAYVGNIAGVLAKLGRHKEALKYYEIDLKIYQKKHTGEDSADLAVKYHNVAGRQYRLQMYPEALENYQKCLKIELKCHDADNPTVGVTYHNLATALDKLGRIQEAKVAVEKAIERLLRTKKEDDEDVQMNRKYLKQLDQRAWMKDLFKE